MDMHAFIIDIMQSKIKEVTILLKACDHFRCTQLKIKVYLH